MRRLAAAAALAGTLVILAGCGEGDWDSNIPPADEIENEAEVRIVTLDDGRQIECLYYAEDGYQRSWLAYDCNWDYDASR